MEETREEETVEGLHVGVVQVPHVKVRKVLEKY